MKRILIGSNNKTKKLEKKKAYKIIGNYAKGFTAYETTGFYDGKEERSLVVEVDGLSGKRVNKIARNLAKDLKQEVIGVQNIKTTIKFVS